MSPVSSPHVSSININKSSIIRTKEVRDFGHFTVRTTATVTVMPTKVGNFRRHHDDSSRIPHIEADPGLQRPRSLPDPMLVDPIRLVEKTRRR
jgi:hypothetical protein